MSEQLFPNSIFDRFDGPRILNLLDAYRNVVEKAVDETAVYVPKSVE